MRLPWITTLKCLECGRKWRFRSRDPIAGPRKFTQANTHVAVHGGGELWLDGPLTISPEKSK